MSTPLYEEGGFKIALGHGWGWESWVYHYCERANGWISCGCIGSGRCGQCRAKIPDEIWGLWKLHNWDHIQVIGV